MKPSAERSRQFAREFLAMNPGSSLGALMKAVHNAKLSLTHEEARQLRNDLSIGRMAQMLVNPSPSKQKHHNEAQPNTPPVEPEPETAMPPPLVAVKPTTPAPQPSPTQSDDLRRVSRELVEVMRRWNIESVILTVEDKAQKPTASWSLTHRRTTEETVEL